MFFRITKCIFNVAYLVIHLVVAIECDYFFLMLSARHEFEDNRDKWEKGLDWYWVTQLGFKLRGIGPALGLLSKIPIHPIVWLKTTRTRRRA